MHLISSSSPQTSKTPFTLLQRISALSAQNTGDLSFHNFTLWEGWCRDKRTHTRTHRHRREGAREQTHSATAKLKQCWGSFHIHKHRSAISPPQVSWKPTHGSMETTWQITESAANESACSSKMRSSGSSGAFRWESLSCVIKRQHDIKPVSFKEPSQIKALQLLSRLITESKQS